MSGFRLSFRVIALSFLLQSAQALQYVRWNVLTFFNYPVQKHGALTRLIDIEYADLLAAQFEETLAQRLRAWWTDPVAELLQ
jgi:hypothetical protein